MPMTRADFVTEALGREVLVIFEDGASRQQLSGILHGAGFKVKACDCMAAAKALWPTASAIICNERLADGNWRDVLAELEMLRQRPPLIVASRAGDESLWAEVLNLGAYDLLLEPFQPEEVLRTVECATRL
jgi:DNA-binding NtrC family response regulator